MASGQTWGVQLDTANAEGDEAACDMMARFDGLPHLRLVDSAISSSVQTPSVIGMPYIQIFNTDFVSIRNLSLSNLTGQVGAVFVDGVRGVQVDGLSCSDVTAHQFGCLYVGYSSTASGYFALRNSLVQNVYTSGGRLAYNGSLYWASEFSGETHTSALLLGKPFGNRGFTLGTAVLIDDSGWYGYGAIVLAAAASSSPCKDSPGCDLLMHQLDETASGYLATLMVEVGTSPYAYACNCLPSFSLPTTPSSSLEHAIPEQYGRLWRRSVCGWPTAGESRARLVGRLIVSLLLECVAGRPRMAQFGCYRQSGRNWLRHLQPPQR